MDEDAKESQTMNSKQKGKRGELEIAHILRDRGYEARRGEQYCGANGDADVIGLPGIHIEVKRVERLNIEEAMQQSKVDAREKEIPVVFHRKNGKEWLCTLRIVDFLDLYEEGSGQWL